jgi:hypothetical protein
MVKRDKKTPLFLHNDMAGGLPANSKTLLYKEFYLSYPEIN